jgi:arylsulfatase A-like enzyme
MKTSLLLSLCLTVWCASLQAAPPNIILMMGDDHGWEETGYNGHPHVKTPVLDEMAATALKFERFYAAHPSCSPTRASFLTGGTRTAWAPSRRAGRSDRRRSPARIILAKAGYHCAHLGKWHVGAVKKESPVSPLSMGFHECLSHDNFFEMNPSLSRNGGPPELFKGESSDDPHREAIQVIERAQKAGKPFFQVIWFGSPHEPYSGLPQDLALYDDLPAKYTKQVKLTSNETGGPTKRPQGEVLRERYAEITAMDRAIGTLRKHLAQNGLRENTLLFYCGDNGTSPDSALGFPHRGAKATFYEGGTLVPGLIEWPARISKPRSTSVRASTSDLLPTVAAIAGQALPDRPLDGIDLAPVLDGTMTARPTTLHFWEYQAGGKSARGEPYIDPELQKGTTPLVKKMGGKATRDFTNFKHPVISEGGSPRRALHHRGRPQARHP